MWHVVKDGTYRRGSSIVTMETLLMSRHQVTMERRLDVKDGRYSQEMCM